MSGAGRQAIRFAFVVSAAVLVSACTGRPGSDVQPVSATATEPAATPVKPADARFAFGSITGVPGKYFQLFSSALDRAAADRKLTVVRSGDSATYVIKGYVSAIGDRSGSTLVYVFDVIDTSGRRIHRISGQEPGGGSGADPWAGITRETVAVAAQHAVDSLAKWVKTG